VLVVFVPLALVLYPFFKLLPRAYDWIMRSKIMPLYDELRSIEREMEAQGSAHAADAIVRDLINWINVRIVYAYRLRTQAAYIRCEVILISCVSDWQ
jgi:hypothetical protein